MLFMMIGISTFCSIFTIMSVQMSSMMLVLTICCLYVTMFYSKMVSWPGFWFFVSYNSGILVLVLYLSSMSFFNQVSLTIFLFNLPIMMMILKLYLTINFDTVITNSVESHFMIFELKNTLVLLTMMSLIIGVLFFISCFMYSSKNPSRLMLPISLHI